MSVFFQNNSKEFFKFFKIAEAKSLDDIGKIGVKNIKSETPVDTGKLKKSNKYEVIDGSTYLINDADYAAYVELGTYKQNSQPFMRQGIANSRQAFINAVIKNMRV